jgi:hypothetical protein
MRLILDFGGLNAGGSPAFSIYKRTDTLADVAQPAFVEIGGGQYYFDEAFATAVSITYKATLNGSELSGVIESPTLSAAAGGSSTATPAVTSLYGYTTVGPLVARALVQAGFLNLSRTQVAAFDPFASTDQVANQALDLLDQLGIELAAEVKTHLERELTITTAGSALSYALPADYIEMVDDSLWNNTGIYPLSGPITPQAERFLHAWNGVTTVRIPFRIMGNRVTFPVAPGNGLVMTGLYISRNWVQTGQNGPDSDHATAATDYVLFDPTLVVLGIKFKLLQAKGHPSAPVALGEYERRLEWAKGNVGSARALSLNGRGSSGFRFVDNYNLPVTGWGLP